MRKFKNLVALGLVVAMVGGLGASATVTSRKNTKDEVVKVEVVFNSGNNDFINEIEFSDGTKLIDYQYEITYKPQPKGFYPIGDYFNYAAWIDRGGEISLRLEPNSSTRRNETYKNDGWRVVSSRTHGFGADHRWKNTQVMQWQYDCHYYMAKDKTHWNLEPHRTSPSYANVVLKGCNP